MKNSLKLFAFGGLFFAFLQIATDKEAKSNLSREADSIFYYTSDSAEIKSLMKIRSEEKGEGK